MQPRDHVHIGARRIAECVDRAWFLALHEKGLAAGEGKPDPPSTIGLLPPSGLSASIWCQSPRSHRCFPVHPLNALKRNSRGFSLTHGDYYLYANDSLLLASGRESSESGQDIRPFPGQGLVAPWPRQQPLRPHSLRFQGFRLYIRAPAMVL